MKNTWHIEYEIPPLRAIYTAYGDENTEDEAREAFKIGFPRGRIRKIRPLCMACECPIDKDGCGCNPPELETINPKQKE